MTHKPRKNFYLVLNLAMLVTGMVMLTYASVPLYRLFCQVTGYGGTTQKATAAPQRISERSFTVKFNADIDKDLPWKFTPLQREVTVKAGQQALVFYTAENTAEVATTGHAVYNVLPNTAGIYFNKIECFCFKDQTLQPGQKVTMPISFFIDPDIDQDKELSDVKELTLSYTFFKAKN